MADSLNNDSLIMQAIKQGDVEQLSRLIESAEDRDALLRHPLSSSDPSNPAIGTDATMLQFASYRSRKDGGDPVRVLLDHGATMDLHSASGLGNTDRIEELLDGDPGLLNHQVDTYVPLQYAITGASVASIECLMRYGDDANRELKKVAYFGWENEALGQEVVPWRPIHMASLWGFDATRVPVAECLMKSGADLNAVSPLDGYHPIHLVAMPNRVDMIRFYLENGVDVDIRSVECSSFRLTEDNAGPLAECYDCTPLMIACGEGFVEAAECLLDAGADVNAQNSLGQSALHLAARKFWNGQPYNQVIELLVS
ncbi:MAG: ankyrin repeat domain-containing protein, partial [Planctomycetota bacterium]